MVELEYNSGKLVHIGSAPSAINDVRIWDYIERWNNSIKRKFNSPFKLKLIYHTCEDLYGGNEYSFGQKENYITGNSNVPTVHMTLFDIFSESDKLPEVKRYKKIVDSSIWNFYVPIEINGDNFNYDRFNNALEKIDYNTKNGLYNLSVANEYANLNARLTEQSYLSGSHHSISPFLFHSENDMWRKMEDYRENKRLKNDNLDIIQGYRWRFLLLDDKSIKQMSTPSKVPLDVNKLQIIARNLQHVLSFKEDNIWFRAKLNNSNVFEQYGKVKDGQWQDHVFTITNAYPQKPEYVQIVIDCVETIDEAKRCLQKYRYEALLLDYLLDNEFGYILLDELQKWNKERKELETNNKQSSTSNTPYKAGPNKRFFIMFISAFTTAVHERMLEKGYGKTERGLWHLGDGACPTNTPYLFSYQLLLLMRHRITDLRKENEGGYLTIIELLKEIFIKDCDTLEDIRTSSNIHFKHVLFMRNKYLQLEEDLTKKEENSSDTGENILNMESSLLIQSAFQYINLFSGSFFEHLQHLVYLTAYGTIQQCDELWEEYISIRKTLIKYDELTKGKDGMEISNAIRNYIINLKSNSNR